MATVMIVDDSIAMRHILKKVFKQHTKHEVVAEAENGQVAIEKYAEFKPDLVTMDITMPVMDGVEATQKIMASYPKAKIIMVSAVGQKATILEAIKAGAKNFLVKPFNGQKVRQVIESVLSGKAAAV